MALGNDTRGWIMACVSGVACIIGAAIICVDLLVQYIPRCRNFKIQDSNNFLASSLSLSFGVMLFSALYNMLPSSKSSLMNSGMSSAGAAYTMIGCFLGGVIGIQLLSYALHRFIPSHVVDCDHAHKEGGEAKNGGKGHQELPSDIENQNLADDRPLLSRDDYSPTRSNHASSKITAEVRQRPDASRPNIQNSRRPSLQVLRSFMSTKSRCGEGGPCFGYSNPCGNECYKNILDPKTTPFRSRSTSQAIPGTQSSHQESGMNYGSFANANGNGWKSSIDSDDESYSTIDDDRNDRHHHSRRSSHTANHHHHHVASNAFLSIGLQTSIAIALHKLPEGFITFATNHANPKLGFSVFMALFIHNITEGFALALPLYLAINSRITAMIWASILGGASQPLGAGIAVLWFKVAKSRDMVPSEGVYGVMFAITSGIMTSVALQLFSESLTLTHNKVLCITFAFIGMGILGFSNAMTA